MTKLEKYDALLLQRDIALKQTFRYLYEPVKLKSVPDERFILAKGVAEAKFIHRELNSASLRRLHNERMAYIREQGRVHECHLPDVWDAIVDWVNEQCGKGSKLLEASDTFTEWSCRDLEV